MRYLISFDPGGHTGWAIAGVPRILPIHFLDGGQIPGGVDGFVEWFLSDQMWKYPMLDADNEGVTVVSESFVLDGRTKFPDVTPLRIEGALSALLGPDTVVYQRNTAKGKVGDQLLRDSGLWLKGQRHQNDARLHALAWAKTNHAPTVRAYWPELLED